MNLKEAMKRIEELERKVKELESRPAQQIHYHTHQAPYVAPSQPLQPYWTPTTPQPPLWPNVWLSGAGAANVTGCVTDLVSYKVNQ